VRIEEEGERTAMPGSGLELVDDGGLAELRDDAKEARRQAERFRDAWLGHVA